MKKGAHAITLRIVLGDRYYMREEAAPGRFSAAIILVIVNVAAFILQELNKGYFHSSLEFSLMLHPNGIKSGYIWQLLTFQFLHADGLHLFFNILGLYTIGRTVEEMIGTKRFLTVYFLSGTIGGIVQVLLGFLVPSVFARYTVGASAGVFGIFSVLATMHPDAPVLFWFIPMRAKYINLISAAIAIFYILVPAPAAFTYAHGAHLGGIIVGYAYVRWLMNRDWALPKFNFRRDPRPRELVGAPAGGFWKKAKAIPPQEDIPSGDFISKEVDPILDKIHEHGMQSLTDQERRILEAARAKMSRR